MRILAGGLAIAERGERPLRCDCCSPNPRRMERALNGPDSVIWFCPSSRKAYVQRNGLLSPMPGFYSGDFARRTLLAVTA